MTLLQGDRRRWPPNARLLRDGRCRWRSPRFHCCSSQSLTTSGICPTSVDELVIEFLLPLELLSLPVDQWQVEEDELARPLCVEHHVIVRYRDRSQVRGGYGQWRGKTRRLRNGKCDGPLG